MTNTPPSIEVLEKTVADARKAHEKADALYKDNKEAARKAAVILEDAEEELRVAVLNKSLTDGGLNAEDAIEAPVVED